MRITCLAIILIGSHIMSFRLVPKSSAEGPRDATGMLYNCEVEIL